MTRSIEAGYFLSIAGGRTGRATRLPPQLGHMPFNAVSAQCWQKVHSKVQIMASVESGVRSLLQHSQLGLSSSILSSVSMLFSVQ